MGFLIPIPELVEPFDDSGVIITRKVTINENGLVSSDFLNLTLERGYEIRSILFDRLVEFDGTPSVDWKIEAEGNTLFDASDTDFTVGKARKIINYVMQADGELSADVSFSGGSTGGGVFHVETMVKVKSILKTSSTVYVIPETSLVFIAFTGVIGEQGTVVIDGTSFIVGNVAGIFTFDIGGTSETPLPNIGDSVNVTVGVNTYTIQYEGTGSQIFSVANLGEVQPIYNNIRCNGANDYGELLTGNTTPGDATPETLPYANIKQIVTNSTASYLVQEDGDIYDCGRNNKGQLWTGDEIDVFPVVQDISLGTEIDKIFHNENNTIVFALLKDKTLKSDGDNRIGVGHFGALAMGTTIDYNGAIQTPAFTNVVKVALGYNHAVILLGDGTVWTCGGNDRGQLFMGNTTDYSGAIQQPAYSNVVDIWAGDRCTWLKLSSGTVLFAGSGSEGQSGLGDVSNYTTPQTMPFTNIKKIVSKGNVSYFLLDGIEDGEMKTSGYNGVGQLFMGTTTDYLGVVQKPPYSNIKDVDCGNDVAVILFNDRTIKTVGENYYGQLLIGNTNNVYPTVQTPSYSDVDIIACGNSRIFIGTEQT